MMYFYKSAALGYAADGTPLPPDMWINPLIKSFNAMNYDAYTLGNHEFNFGNQIFVSSLKTANFPVLQANIADDGQYGLAEVPVQPYLEKMVGPESVRVAILGIGNHRVPNYELPSNIPGLTFSDPLAKAQELSDQLRASNDIVLALTHIGFTENPGSVEIDSNVDTNLAATVSGVDLIIGGHSHTNPVSGFGNYKFLPTIVGGPDNTPVLINHAYRYNNTLGEVVIGVRPNTTTGYGYDVVSRAGRYISIALADPEDPAIDSIIAPYVAMYQTYVNTEIGETYYPIDALQAYTQETNGANLQADSSVWELEEHNGIPVDFHLSGAMSNRKVADGATPATPVMLKVNDMFSLMPYENSLVVMEMNGPQIKAVLERGYRNYYYYKYVPGYGGYSYYTTCMLTTDAGNQITYWDTYPALPNGNNVASLVVNGQPIDFEDADTYYRVSTVNYLAAGSCNFNNAGATLWPLNQIVNDTQFYVRDAVINYITAMETVSPTIEGRLEFNAGARLAVGHLAPFAMDPGTAVTVTLNGDAALTNFEFADSTAYITVPPGDYDLEVIPAGSTEPAITGTVSLITGTDYTAIATGDGANQALGLLALVDDNTAPAAGTFHLRLGHLAPFAAGDALADVRLQDGTVILDDVAFGDVTGFTPLPAGVYDLKITSPDGTMTYIDPLPVTFNDGDIVSAYAVGDGVNQPLGVFAWPSNAVGFLLPLTEYSVELTPAEAAQTGAPGDTVMYTLELTNTGSLSNTFEVTYTGNAWDVLLSETSIELGAGESAALDVTVTIAEDAEDGDMDVVTIEVNGDGGAMAASELTTTAEVIVPTARLAVGHLAPFAMDPGTAVTVTLNGTPVLTGFEFADSTAYLDIPAGITHTVEIFAAGVVTPAISAQINLMEGMDYTAIAVGGANGWPLDLLALLDDNTAPAAGKFHLRLGHLAPFTDTLTGTLADIRLQDGTPVITDVPFGAVTAYIPLDAGTYDLKITTPGGAVTLIDPLPVVFAEGDIVSAFAVGDGVNQPLGVFAWPSDEVGFLLPLEGPKMVYLPLIPQAYEVP
jgi:2',3'-cyclic-nucleotide 2'-phosphodiesterase (5'-nucleotidase family)